MWNEHCWCAIVPPPASDEPYVAAWERRALDVWDPEAWGLLLDVPEVKKDFV